MEGREENKAWNKAAFLRRNSIEYQCVTRVRYYMKSKKDSVFSSIRWKEQ